MNSTRRQFLALAVVAPAALSASVPTKELEDVWNAVFTDLDMIPHANDQRLHLVYSDRNLYLDQFAHIARNVYDQYWCKLTVINPEDDDSLAVTPNRPTDTLVLRHALRYRYDPLLLLADTSSRLYTLDALPYQMKDSLLAYQMKNKYQTPGRYFRIPVSDCLTICEGSEANLSVIVDHP